jgi:hypothetical protein
MGNQRIVTMRQAIEEGFILYVLKTYTTYATYFKLLKAREDDPNVERKKAASALARFLRLHPHNIAQKTEVMVLPAANLLQPSPSPSPNFVTSETMEVPRMARISREQTAQSLYLISVQ